MRLIKYEWLKKYLELEDRISFLTFNLNQSKRELKRWVEGDLSDIKLTEKSKSAHLEKNIQKIKYELSILKDDKKDLLELIDTFKDLDHAIVKGKYIDDKSLEQIAYEESYSVGYIRHKHASIMRTIDFLKEYQN